MFTQTCKKAQKTGEYMEYTGNREKDNLTSRKSTTKYCRECRIQTIEKQYPKRDQIVNRKLYEQNVKLHVRIKYKNTSGSIIRVGRKI